MPIQKTRNYSRYVNDGKEEDAMNRVSTRGAIAKTMPAAGYAYAFPFCLRYLFY
ncbi:hypothetical protein [Nostoc sp.]|uniref:hypothetical protein n=1 Tax=Nostoc sp. TaxID=1180 RepID=UPI002FF8C631